MKKSKNFVLFMLAIIAIVSCFSIPASAAGNYYDSSYDTGDHSIADPDTFYHTFPSTLAYDSNVVIDEDNPYGIRQKMDATATYVYNKEGSSFMFTVVGYSHNYGGNAYINDSRQAGRIDVGQRRFLRQWVYENGHGYCALYTASIYDRSYSTGLWSPDSIGSYPYAND